MDSDTLRRIPNLLRKYRRIAGFKQKDVAARYPYLYPELEREKNSKNQYLVRMFEAVALGAVALGDPDPYQEKVANPKGIHA